VNAWAVGLFIMSLGNVWVKWNVSSLQFLGYWGVQYVSCAICRPFGELCIWSSVQCIVFYWVCAICQLCIM